MGNFYVPKRWNKPLCFPTPEVFGRWRELARSANSVGPDSYCCDCTPSYHDRMVALGRCEHPGTQFDIDEDGFIRGKRPAKGEPVQVKSGGKDIARIHFRPR